MKYLLALLVGCIKQLVLLLTFLTISNVVFAQANCIRVDQISKWEVLDASKAIAYDNQGNSIAFFIFDYQALKKNGETFRFFSPTICNRDRVQTSSTMLQIMSNEPIRK